jgi:hypothetical protein
LIGGVAELWATAEQQRYVASIIGGEFPQNQGLDWMRFQ